MPWKEQSAMDQKQQFVKEALELRIPFSILCQRYGISRQWGHKVLKRYLQIGSKSGLESKSRKPNTSPTATSDELVKLILDLRYANPKWGGRKIRSFLLCQGHTDMPSEKTVNRILKKHGCINPEESSKRKPYIRFEHANPNDLWQMDFKGHFQAGTDRCHPLTLLDDHSRFSLAIVSCANEQKNTVIQALINVFRSFGLPKRMTMDNGSPWGYGEDQRYTAIDIWLIRLGIRVSHSRPYHPQTQGKLERFHRTLKLELLEDYYFDNLEHAQKGFDWWRKRYNEERPHEAIGMKVPRDRYNASERIYPETLGEIEFPEGVCIRKVDGNGRLCYKGRTYKIGKGLIGQPVGLKNAEDRDNILEVFYCHQKVLELQKT